jgi:hypothetical protein
MTSTAITIPVPIPTLGCEYYCFSSVGFGSIKGGDYRRKKRKQERYSVIAENVRRMST